METELLWNNNVDGDGGEIWENSCNCHSLLSPCRDFLQTERKKNPKCQQGTKWHNSFCLSSGARASLSLSLWFPFFINLLSHTLFDNRCPDGGDTRISLNAFCGTYIINRRQQNWKCEMPSGWRREQCTLHTHARERVKRRVWKPAARMFFVRFSFTRTRTHRMTTLEYPFDRQCFGFFSSSYQLHEYFLFVPPSPNALCAVWICGTTVSSSRAMKVAIICHGH